MTDRTSSARFRRTYLAGTLLAAFSVLAIQSGTVLTVIGLALRDLGTATDVGPAMAVFLAASLVGMGAAGVLLRWISPGRLAVISMSAAATGLAIAATASTLTVFVGGRLVQGMGSGSSMVVLYVLAAAGFEGAGRARLLRAVSTAWMLPTIVAPLLAGWFTDVAGWRAAFLACVAAGIVVSGALVVVGRAPYRTGAATWHAFVAAVLGGAAVCVIQLLPTYSAPVSVAGGIVCLALLLVTIYAMLPRGTLFMRRGIPAGVALRGVVAGAFFGVEAWVPLMLIDDVGVSAAAAGAMLGLGGVCWIAGVRFPGLKRAGVRSPAVRDLVISCWIVAAGLAGLAVVAAGFAHVIPVAVAWGVACFGMGSALPRISILVFDRAADSQVAEVSLGLQSSDAIGCVVVVALAGLCFGALEGAANSMAYVAVFGLGAAVAIGGAASASRVADSRVVVALTS